MIRTVPFTLGTADGRTPRPALLEWLVREGDHVAAGEPLCRYEVDKAVAVYPSPQAGYLRRRLIPEGGRIAPGAALALMANSLSVPLPNIPVAHESEADARHDFDWSEIDNRAGPPEPLNVMRRAIADRMAMSKRNIPCFYLTVSVDMTSCLALRKRLKKHGGKATFNDMAIKAAALALVANPKVAGVFVPEGVVPRTDLHIGFAAALPDDGLVVPVVKHADRKTLVEIAADTRRLAARAKDGQLTPGDCSGGVFSVSYLGAYDVDNFVAIVNPGEAAIAAVGKTIDTPVA
ncbi:MAG: 2-oxo acid dehydrogenase subunit E2, partial [Planctomycetes bacterium]|nr:2-oxo acid dehydrogenase subunit E2 [Planctomycetota bacterium]